MYGPEFGQHHVGKTSIIHKALYGLKSSGAAWHSMFVGTLSDLQFSSCLADPMVWFRPAIKRNGEKYYEYIFVSVDDLLIISETNKEIIKVLSESYHFKESSV
jgi:hypothetical protein